MIAEISQYQDGTYLPLPVSGTVKVAWPVKTGVSAAGKKWANQGFVLQGPDGEVNAVLWGDDDGNVQPLAKGDQVELACKTNGKGKLTGVEKKTYTKQLSNGELQVIPQLSVAHGCLRNLSRPAATQAQQYAPPPQFPASAPAGAPIGSHMGPNPAPASFPASTPVPTQKAGVLSEADARSFLLRQHRELGNAIGLWDAPGGADPAINAALMAWCASLLIGVNQGKIEPQQDVTDAPSAHGRPDPW